MVNEWTRDDLPTEDETAETYMAKDVYSVHEGIALVLDAVVDHLNAHYPKPSPEHVVIGGRLTISESQFKRERDVFAHRLENQSETIAEMQGVIKGLHRAHEIVEGERDQAREQWKKWEHKAGEWKSRAESAEQYAQAVSDSNRDNADRASKAERERDEWRASADKWHGAWQKIAPVRAVSRADVAEVIARCLNPEEWNLTFPALVNEVCDLFGVEAEPADPVEAKARELYEVSNPDTVGKWETIHEALKDGYRRIARHVLGQEDRHDGR